MWITETKMNPKCMSHPLVQFSCMKLKSSRQAGVSSHKMQATELISFQFEKYRELLGKKTWVKGYTLKIRM